MLCCLRKPVTAEEAARLKQWLLAAESFSFRGLVQAEVAALQVAAINAKVKSGEYPNYAVDENNALERISELRTMLRVLNEFADDPSKLALADVSVTENKLDL